MKSYLAGIFIIVLLGLFSSLEAQTPVQVNDGIKVEVNFDTQQTPDFQAGNVDAKKIPNPRDWLEVEVQFEPEVAPRKAIVPKIMLRYYVAIESENGTKVITGDVNHVNVLGDEDNFSVAYVSPSMLSKITGEHKGFQSSSVKGAAVEVFFNGVSKGGASASGSPSGRWWEKVPNEAGVLSKDKTPFALLWIDRYADIESN